MNKISSYFVLFFPKFYETKACNAVPLDIVSQGSKPFPRALCFCCWWHQDISFLHHPFFHQNLGIFQFLEKKTHHKQTTVSETGSHCKIWWLSLLPCLRLYRILIKGLEQHLVNRYMNAATDVRWPVNQN